MKKYVFLIIVCTLLISGCSEDKTMFIQRTVERNVTSNVSGGGITGYLALWNETNNINGSSLQQVGVGMLQMGEIPAPKTANYPLEIWNESAAVFRTGFTNNASYGGFINYNDGSNNFLFMTMAGTDRGAQTSFGVSKSNLGRIYTVNAPLAIGTFTNQNFILGANDERNMMLTSGLTTMYTNLDLNHDYNLTNVGVIENPEYIQFNTTYSNGSAEGRLQWNIQDGTLEVGMPGGDVNLQIGQEMLIRSRNVEGEQINNCQAVYVSGATGNVIEVETPIASNVSEAPLTFGLATEDIVNNQLGYVTLIGIVRDCNTSMWSAGDVLYLSDTEEGNLTNVTPVAPNTKVIIGIVRQSSDNGSIAVNPVVVQRLSLSSDVYNGGLADDSMIFYNGSSSRFEFTNNLRQDFFGGEFYAKNNAVDTPIPATSVYVNITEGATLEYVNGVTYDNASFTIGLAGRYEVLGTVSASGGNNRVFHMTAGVNGVEQDNCHVPRKVSALDLGVWSLSCSVNVTANDVVTLMVENVNDDSDILCGDYNFMIKRIGGG